MKSFLRKIPLLRTLRERIAHRIPFNLYTKRVSGVSNRIQIDARILWKTTVHVKGSHNTVIIEGAQLVRNLTLTILGSGNVVYIGPDCQFKSGIIWIEGDANTCRIGAGTTIESAEFYLTEKNTRIELGSDCMLADAIVFRTGDSHSILDIQSEEILNPAGDIILGHHVWVGQGVTLLKQTRVGDGSVIGTRSLINKPFMESNIVLAGVPAKKVRSAVRWVRERLESGTQFPTS